jgi:nucleoside-diphosphate-sugar epimerase
MNKGTILLTGNTGYIGTVMTARLKKAGDDAVGLDGDWFSGSRLFPVPEESKPKRQIVKDIRDLDAEDLEGIDAVIHLAGLSNDPLGELNPRLTDAINHRATMRIAELCKAAGVGRFLFASSCSIYGISSSNEPINEEGVVSPITAYAKAKVDAERGLARLADGNFHPVFMRNATAYGLSPKLRLDLVVNNLLAWAYLTGEVVIMSDGTPWRPIVHVQDFCDAFIAALEAPVEKVHCQAFNVGINEENYQVRDIAREIQKVLPESRMKILNTTGPDERTYRVDFTKIKSALTGFAPQWNLRAGIEELLGAYQRYRLTREDFESSKYFRIRTVKALRASGELDGELVRTGSA